jgi:pimeloyl-ACP methyl ester carboxylesterase
VAERVEIADAVLAYEDSGGDGPAVVLVHGLGGSMFGWRAQVRALADAGYRAVAYDQRGAGLSTKAGGYSIEGWAADAVALIEELGIDRVALVGHSMGCMVAEHAAHRLGERCRALALCGGRASWPEAASEVFAQRAELARSGRMDEVAEAVAAGALSERCRAERPVLHGLLVASIAAAEGDAYAECALATGRGSMRGPSGLDCPLLAMAGSEDAVTPPEAAEEMAAAAADGEAAVIDGAAHWAMLEAPEAVNGLLVPFLHRHRPG